MSDVTILIVEDDIMSMERLRSLLMDFGYISILTASNSHEAFEGLMENTVDLVLMDIELKESKLDGIELTSKINDKFDTPIIYLTGNTSSDIIHKVAQTKHQQFLIKPYTAQQLHASISLTFLQRLTDQSESDKSGSRNDGMLIKSGKKWVKVSISEIVYLESIDGLLHIHTTGSKYIHSASLKHFESKN